MPPVTGSAAQPRRQPVSTGGRRSSSHSRHSWGVLALVFAGLCLSLLQHVTGEPPAPQLVLLGPSQIGTCHQTTFLDSSASVVYDDKHAVYSWTVDGVPVDPAPGTNSTGPANRILVFPTTKAAPASFEVELTVVDSLGRSATVVKTVEKFNRQMAGLYVLHHAVVPSHMPIYLLGRTDFSNQPCNNLYNWASADGYWLANRYSWDFKLSYGMFTLPVDQPEEVASLPRLTQFVLPAGFAVASPQLTYLTALDLQIYKNSSGTVETTSIASAATTWKVSSSPLEVVIAGGQSQVFRENQLISLDGNHSQDPDFPPENIMEPGLQPEVFSHRWRVYRGSGAEQVEVTGDLEAAGVLLNQSHLVVPPMTLAWGDYWVVLTFRSEAGPRLLPFPIVAAREADSEPMHLQILPARAGTLELGTGPASYFVSGEYFIKSNAAPVRMYVQRVTQVPETGAIRYRSLAEGEVHIKWREVRQGLDLAALPPADLLSSLGTPTLSVRHGVFRPHIPYRIRVEIADPATQELLQEAEIEFQVNAPPLPGRCWVDQSQGGHRSLDGFLGLECSGFWDSASPEGDPLVPGQLPLLYMFSFRLANTTADPKNALNEWSLLTGYLPVPRAQVLVPPGEYHFRVTVRDALGAVSHHVFMDQGSPAPVPALVDVAKFVRVRLPLVSGYWFRETPDMNVPEPLECVLHNLLWANPDVAREMGDVDRSLQLVSAGIALIYGGLEELSSRTPEDMVDGWCAPDHTPPISSRHLTYDVKEWQVEVINQVVQAMLTVFEQSQVTPEMSSQVITQTSAVLNSLLMVPGNRFSDGLTLDAALDLLDGVQHRMSPEGTMMVLRILSKLLETVDCSRFNDVVGTIRILTQRTLDGVLPDEAAQDGSANGIDYSAIRANNGPNSSVSLDSDQMMFDLNRYDNPLSGDEDFVDVTVIRYDENARRCRQGAVGNIVDIKFGMAGQGTNASHVNGKFVFDLPLDSDVGEANIGRDYELAQSCSGDLVWPVCGWWQADAANEEDRWQSSGCAPEGRFPIRLLSNGRYVLRCNCEHLTEFAALMRVRQGVACQRQQANDVYASFVGFYMLLAAVAALQCVRIAFAESSDRAGLARRRESAGCGLFARCSSVLLQHTMITLAAFTRGLACVALSGYVDWKLEAVGVLSALPYLFVFIIFTLMIFQWVVIHSVSSTKMRGVDQLMHRFRPVFIGANIGAALMITILCLSIVTDMSDHPEDVAMAGSIVVCLMVLVTGSAFAVYGYKIAQALESKATASMRMNSARNNSRGMESAGGSASAGTSDRTGGHRLLPCLGEVSIATKMKVTGATVFVLFLIEAILWVHSAALVKSGEDEGEASTAVFLLCDLLALTVIMLLYRQAVSRLVEGHQERTGGGKHASGFDSVDSRSAGESQHSRGPTNKGQDGGSSKVEENWDTNLDADVDADVMMDSDHDNDNDNDGADDDEDIEAGVAPAVAAGPARDAVKTEKAEKASKKSKSHKSSSGSGSSNSGKSGKSKKSSKASSRA